MTPAWPDAFDLEVFARTQETASTGRLYFTQPLNYSPVGLALMMQHNELAGPDSAELNSQKKDLAIVLYTVFAVFVMVAMAIWSVVILSLAGITSWPSASADGALFLFAMTLALMCAFMWVFHHLQIIHLDALTEHRLWVALVGSVLGAVAAAVTQQLY
jgi:hypothetical protein